MGGLLLKLKGHSESSLSNLRAHTEIGRPYVRVEPIDDDGNVVVLEGHDVRCETPDGQVLEERPEIRRLFPKKSRRRLHWDRLDALYFVAYTQWTYNALPALLSRDDIRVDRRGREHAGRGALRDRRDSVAFAEACLGTPAGRLPQDVAAAADGQAGRARVAALLS
jgi:hypothetical protein